MLKPWDFLVVDHSSGNPYIDLDLPGGTIFRYFDNDLTNEWDLIWHRDEHTRIVTIVNANSWSFQYDNEMPFELKDDMTITIPAMAYHRVIMGDGVLSLRIKEIA
jgi:hypothetical protein